MNSDFEVKNNQIFKKKNSGLHYRFNNRFYKIC